MTSKHRDILVEIFVKIVIFLFVLLYYYCGVQCLFIILKYFNQNGTGATVCYGLIGGGFMYVISNEKMPAFMANIVARMCVRFDKFLLRNMPLIEKIGFVMDLVFIVFALIAVFLALLLVAYLWVMLISLYMGLWGCFWIWIFDQMEIDLSSNAGMMIIFPLGSILIGAHVFMYGKFKIWLDGKFKIWIGEKHESKL